MAKTRKTYTNEFKVEAIRLLKTSGKSAAQIERDLGIGSGCLGHWKRELEENGDQAFPGHGRLVPDRERIHKLERENKILRQERDILKKSSGYLLAPKTMRFQYIENHRNEFPITLMCGMLGVSSSGYYAWRKRPPSKREMANRELYKKIKIVWRITKSMVVHAFILHSRNKAWSVARIGWHV